MCIHAFSFLLAKRCEPQPSSTKLLLPIIPIGIVVYTFALLWDDLCRNSYYHLRSTVKRERFFAHVYFSNETVSQTTVSTGPMKMFRLEHETMNVCQRNVARFGHVECMFDKVNDIFQGFGSLGGVIATSAERWMR